MRIYVNVRRKDAQVVTKLFYKEPNSFFPSRLKPTEQSQSFNNSSESSTQNPYDSNSSLNSVTLASKSGVKGLLQIVKVTLSSSNGSQTTWALCDSACSRSWLTRKPAQHLKLEGRPICLTVNSIDSQEVVNTEMVELNLSSLDGLRETYKLSPYLKDNINVGTDVIDIASLESIYPHLAPLKAEKTATLM